MGVSGASGGSIPGQRLSRRQAELGGTPTCPHPADGVVLGEALGAPDLGGPPALLRPLRGGRGLRARGGGWSWTLPQEGWLPRWAMLSPAPAAVPLTWLPEMRGAEGMRCRASRLCSMPVSSCSFAWHSDSSATERARSGMGDRASPPPCASPLALLTGRAALQPFAVLQPGVHLVPGAGEVGESRGAARGQDPRPLALQQGRRGTAGAAVRSPAPRHYLALSPRGVTHLRVGGGPPRGTPPGAGLGPLALVMGAEAAHPAGEELWGLDLWDRGKLGWGRTQVGGTQSPQSRLQPPSAP